MKVLLLTSFFPPTHTAGTEMRTLGYARELQKLGHEVRVVCVENWDKGKEYWNGYIDEIYEEIRIRKVNLNWILAADPNRFLYHNPVIEKQMTHWLDEWQPDVVHITSCLTLSASVIKAVKDHKTPIVLTLTDFWFICPRINLLHGNGTLCDGYCTSRECLECKLWDSNGYQKLKKVVPETFAIRTMEWASKQPSISRIRGLRGIALDMDDRKAYLSEMFNAVDYITAPSAFLSSIFRTSVVDKPIQTIYSGHNLNWLATSIEKRPATTLRIGYIGQIIPAKGLHTLLTAFKSAKISDRASMSIYGDINKSLKYWQQLDALTENNPSIQFHGEFQHNELGKVFSEIDVLVVPSEWHENNPRVIQEAFASKTPVIATNVGGISEFVTHDKNGLLFELGRADDLAHQLQRVVDEPGLLERLRAGIPPVRTIQESIETFVKIYTELIQTTKVR